MIWSHPLNNSWQVCFNQGNEAGGGRGVNVGQSLSPPSHFILATGLSPLTTSLSGNIFMAREVIYGLSIRIRTVRIAKGIYKELFTVRKLLACENIRFPSLFVAGDVSRGGTSATQRQKFHTDDVKSVRNPVRSADWSTQQLHCFSYCL